MTQPPRWASIVAATFLVASILVLGLCELDTDVSHETAYERQYLTAWAF